jgi:UPF0755 protein
VNGQSGPGGYPGKQPRDGSIRRGYQGNRSTRGNWGDQGDYDGYPGYDGRGNPNGAPGYGGQDYDNQGYSTRGYGQQHRPQPGRDRVRGARQPFPPGYDQRAEVRYGQQGNYEEQGDESFLPGFGRRDEFEGARPADRGRGQGHGRGYEGYDDRRDPRGGGGRGPGGAGGRGPGGLGPRGRNDGQGNYDRNNRRPDPRRRKTRWIPRVLLLVILLALVGGGGGGALWLYHRYEAKYHPADYFGDGTGPTVMIQVRSGENASQLAPTMLQMGVVASDRAFVLAAESSTNPTGLEPGFYLLKHHMQASLAYAALLNPKNRVQTTVTIPEGKRASQVALILAKYSKIPLKDFQQIIAHPPASLGLPPAANGKVEGYLFPATYAVIPHETALQVLQAMVQRFNVEAEQIGLDAAAKKAGLTSSQVIIEASLAQAEGGSVADFPKIAEVMNNRLKIGMQLRFDSAVLYGLGKYGTSATFQELRIDTPYNIYMHTGLPIGPIGNPGDAAIRAILHPDKGDYLYFLSKPSGATEFSHNCLPGQC